MASSCLPGPDSQPTRGVCLSILIALPLAAAPDSCGPSHRARRCQPAPGPRRFPAGSGRALAWLSGHRRHGVVRPLRIVPLLQAPPAKRPPQTSGPTQHTSYRAARPLPVRPMPRRAGRPARRQSPVSMHLRCVARTWSDSGQAGVAWPRPRVPLPRPAARLGPISPGLALAGPSTLKYPLPVRRPGPVPRDKPRVGEIDNRRRKN